MHRLSLLLLFACFTSISRTQTSSSKIFTAIKNNDIKEIRALLEQDTDPTSYDEDGHNLLMWVSLYSFVDCMQLLLEKSSNNKISFTKV